MNSFELVSKQQPSHLHEAVLTNTAVGYRLRDTREEPSQPSLSGENSYGMISPDVNAGLLQAQARPFTREAYNSGCVNLHGCVSSEGKCRGPVKTGSPGIQALYKELNSPLAPDDFDHHPPQHVLGIRQGTINSVTGWHRREATQACEHS